MSSSFLFGTGVIPKVLEWLHDTDVFVSSYSTSFLFVIMARINMTEMTLTWHKNISCSQLGSCNFHAFSESVYNSESNTIYLSLAENYKIFFFTLDSNDGSASSLQIADDFNRVDKASFIDSQTINILARKSSNSVYYIFSYHISNSSFTQLKFSDATRVAYDFSYSLVDNRIVYFGSIN